MNQQLNYIAALAYKLKDIPNDVRLRVVWNGKRKTEVFKLENGEVVPANDPEVMPYMDRKMRGI